MHSCFGFALTSFLVSTPVTRIRAHFSTRFLSSSTAQKSTRPSSVTFGIVANGARFISNWNGRSSTNLAMASVLELEQKFAVSPTTTKNRLCELGFHQVKEIDMVDWYFDFPSRYPLMRQDTFLRYREVLDKSAMKNNNSDQHADDCTKINIMGQWELKRGDHGSEEQSSSPRTTVYQEMVGEKAIAFVRDLLHSNDEDFQNTAEHTPLQLKDSVQDISLLNEFKPNLPPGLPSVQPFARIVTHRSSWKVPVDGKRNIAGEETKESWKYADLTVDLDETDFGHNVGEVEVLVPQVPTSVDLDIRLRNAKVLIQELIDRLAITTTITNTVDTTTQRVDNAATVAAKGKLEYFLETQKPSIYAIMKEVGLVP